MFRNSADIVNSISFGLLCGTQIDRYSVRQCVHCKGKGKVHPTTGHEGPEGEKKYYSTLSLTSALDVVGDQRHAPTALPPAKTRYPLYRRLVGPQGRSGRVWKISPLNGIRSPDLPARSESQCVNCTVTK